MLKNKLFAVAVAALVMFGATFASAATLYKVGSPKSDEVKTIQTVVGVTADGVFGKMTKAAVQAWQASHGLTADGVVGPLTWAAMTSSSSSTTTVAGCGAGALFNSMTGAPCTTTSSLPAGCVAGALFSSTTGQSCTAAPSSTVSSTGEGSLTVTYDAVPADNLAVKHGENKAVMALKLKATGSDMKVSRVWLDINKRIWLSADSASILDGSTVLATLPLNSSTVIETTVGSNWQMQFNGLSVVVPEGTTKILTLTVNRPTLTSANDSVTVASTSSVRAVDGAGISTAYTMGARTINLSDSAAAAVGTLTATLNSNSPATQSVAGLSATAGTLTAVKLMDFDLKSKDGPINVSAIAGTVASSGSVTLSNEISSLELRDGSSILASVSGGATFSFTSLNIDIAQDTTKTLSIYAQMNPVGTPGAGYTTKGDGISAVVTTVTATSGPTFADKSLASQTVTSNTQYMYRYAPTLTLGAVSAVQADESTSTTVYKGANYSIAFTVTAPAGSDIYVDTPATLAAIAKTTASYGGTLSASSAVSGVSSKGASYTAADKVAAGTSRTFTFTGYVPHGTASGFVGMKVVSVKWTDTDNATTPAPVVQTWGLSDFHTADVYVTI